MRRVYYLLILVLILASCTSSIHVQVLRPADITLPDSIEVFAVANRSIPSKESQVGNIVEGIFSGEGIGSDRRASGSAIVGITNGLMRSPRYDVTQAPYELYGTGTSRMPEPLSWEQVEEICNRTNSQALIVLETFDTDARRQMDSKIRTKKVDDQKVEYTEYIADLDMRVNTGWRIYYPAERMIVDQFVFEDHKGFRGTGESEEQAISRLPIAEQGAREAAIIAGESYASRISPVWVQVARSYYTGGSADMKLATRRAQSNDWLGAAQIWKKLAEASKDPKIRKRAAYNMSLACEIQGKMDLAIDWAKKARDLGLKRGVARILELEQRVRDEQRVNDQMGG